MGKSKGPQLEAIFGAKRAWLIDSPVPGLINSASDRELSEMDIGLMGLIPIKGSSARPVESRV